MQNSFEGPAMRLSVSLEGDAMTCNDQGSPFSFFTVLCMLIVCVQRRSPRA